MPRPERVSKVYPANAVIGLLFTGSVWDRSIRAPRDLTDGVRDSDLSDAPRELVAMRIFSYSP